MDSSAGPVLWVNFGIAVLVAPLFVARVYLWLRRVGGPTRFVAAVWRALVGCRRRRSGDDGDAGNAELQELVVKRVSERRVKYARAAVAVGWTAVCLAHFSYVARDVDQLWGSGRSGALVDGSTERRLLLLLLLVLLTIAAIFPQVVNVRTLPVLLWFVTGILCMMSWASALAGSSAEDLLRGGPLTALASLSLGALYLSFPSLFMCSFFVFVSSVGSAQIAKSTCGQGANMWNIVVMEFGTWLWKVGLYYWADQTMRHSVRTEVEAAMGTCQRSAVSSLLDQVCDAVVDLDCALALKEHSQRLAGLLMHRPGKRLGGAAFADFIASGEDKERFERIVGESRDNLEELVPHMFSVRMRDATGNNFGAVLHHVPYVSLQGSVHHLVGLQEAADGRPCDGGAAERREGLQSQRPLPEAVLSPEVACALRNAEGPAGRGVLQSDSASNSSATCSESDHLLIGSAVVVAEEGLPVVMAEAPFSQRFGIAADGFVEDLFPVRRDGECLRAQILDVAAKVRSGEVPPHVGTFGVWKLASVADSGRDSGRAGASDRFLIRAEFKAKASPDDIVGQMAKLSMYSAPRDKRHGWRARRGPLTEGSGKSADNLKVPNACDALAPQPSSVGMMRL